MDKSSNWELDDVIKLYNKFVMASCVINNKIMRSIASFVWKKKHKASLYIRYMTTFSGIILYATNIQSTLKEGMFGNVFKIKTGLLKEKG